jgi:hypothetical protein
MHTNFSQDLGKFISFIEELVFFKWQWSASCAITLTMTLSVPVISELYWTFFRISWLSCALLKHCHQNNNDSTDDMIISFLTNLYNYFRRKIWNNALHSDIMIYPCKSCMKKLINFLTFRSEFKMTSFLNKHATLCHVLIHIQTIYYDTARP